MRRRPWKQALVLAAGYLAAAGPAQAEDSFSWTRSEQLVEKGHDVEITLARDHARIKVERTLYNGADRPDQATFHIYTDPSAIAIDLQTMAVVNGEPHWFKGELMEAEAAAKKYQELTGIGGYYPKDPALLSWRTRGHLALQVFPCMPKQEKKVAYTLLAPMQYVAGRYVLELPAMGTKKVAPWAKITASSGTVLVNGEAPDGELSLDTSRLIEQKVDFSGPMHGALGVTPYAKDKALAGFHFDVSPELSTVPDKVRVVVLLDASRSIPEEDRAAARAAALSYLSHFDGSDAQAAVFFFSRTVDPVTKGFVKIEDARKALAAATLAAKNGSELGVALDRASKELVSAGSGLERRVLLLTDLRTRGDLTPDVVRPLAPAGATLHLADVRSGAAQLSRDDDDDWAKVPRSTGGVLWNASAPVEADGEALRVTVFEEWARPLRIDRLALTGPGVDAASLEVTALAEGEGIEQHFIASRFVSHVSLSGELWSRPVKKTLEPEAEYGKRRAALVFGTSLTDEMSEEEMMTLALYGRAVSPVTSYLAIEPGVRPSTEGLESGETGVGFGFGSGSGRLSGGHRTRPPSFTDWPALLKALLAPAKAKCGLGDKQITVSVESTLAEIVKVDASVPGLDDKSTALKCFVDATWEAELPDDFLIASSRTTTAVL